MSDKLDNDILAVRGDECDNGNYLVSQEALTGSNKYSDKWYFKPINGKKDTYNIISNGHRNCERNFLSVGSECKQTYIDLWHRDDGSGRQQWTVKLVEKQGFVFSITANGRP